MHLWATSLARSLKRRVASPLTSNMSADAFSWTSFFIRDHAEAVESFSVPALSSTTSPAWRRVAISCGVPCPLTAPAMSRPASRRAFFGRVVAWIFRNIPTASAMDVFVSSFADASALMPERRLSMSNAARRKSLPIRTLMEDAADSTFDFAWALGKSHNAHASCT